MARFELKLPKMGESVATITNWLKEVGDKNRGLMGRSRNSN
jgi:2-oxoglutarate dehydrogenase E2 component (dihydrolipoamide succinyltransferase)